MHPLPKFCLLASTYILQRAGLKRRFKHRPKGQRGYRKSSSYILACKSLTGSHIDQPDTISQSVFDGVDLILKLVLLASRWYQSRLRVTGVPERKKRGDRTRGVAKHAGARVLLGSVSVIVTAKMFD